MRCGTGDPSLHPDFGIQFSVRLHFLSEKVVYVTLNTTYAFNRSAIYLPDGLPVFINAYGFPLLCYCVLVLLIDLLKQLLFAAGKDLALSFSDILSMIRHLRFWDGIYLVTVHNP